MNQSHAHNADDQRKLLVLGMGVTGLSVAHWCQRNTVDAVFVDSRERSAAEPRILRRCCLKRISVAVTCLIRCRMA